MNDWFYFDKNLIRPKWQLILSLSQALYEKSKQRKNFLTDLVS